MINSTVENYQFNYPDMLRKNEFWMDYIYRREAYGDHFVVPTPEEYRKLINRENLDEFMKKAVDMDNYIEVKLIPERLE